MSLFATILSKEHSQGSSMASTASETKPGNTSPTDGGHPEDVEARLDDNTNGQQNGEAEFTRTESPMKEDQSALESKADNKSGKRENGGKRTRGTRGGRGRGERGEPNSEGHQNGTPRKQHDENKHRLFVGNLSNDTTEDDIRTLFGQHTTGNLGIFFDKQKWFAFVSFETKEECEKAKKATDGLTFKTRVIRVRDATRAVSLAVKNLGANVSNELLFRAFEKFGDLERAVVTVDEKGRSSGEGILVFSRKDKAMQVMNRVNDGVFLLGTSPRPVIIEMMEQKDSEDGLPEVHVLYRQGYKNEITEAPRFAKPGSLEYDFGQRWKKLYDDHMSQVRHLNNMFQEACESLEKEMDKSIEDFEINKIRQNIAQQEQKMQQLMQKLQRRSGDGGRSQKPPLSQDGPYPPRFPSAEQPRLPIPPPGFGAPPAFPGQPPFPEPSQGYGPGPANPFMGAGPRPPFGYPPAPPQFGGQFDNRGRGDNGIDSFGDRFGGGGGGGYKRAGGQYQNGKRQRN